MIDRLGIEYEAEYSLTILIIGTELDHVGMVLVYRHIQAGLSLYGGRFIDQEFLGAASRPLSRAIFLPALGQQSIHSGTNPSQDCYHTWGVLVRFVS
jgi:hypothetical protein